MNKNISIETPTVTFPIIINFPECDVDMVLKESMASGGTGIINPAMLRPEEINVDESKLPKTPTDASVTFTLNMLAGFVDREEMKILSSRWGGSGNKTELEELGLEVIEWMELIQGQCELQVRCKASEYTPALVFKAHHLVYDIFEKYIIYHK